MRRKKRDTQEREISKEYSPNAARKEQALEKIAKHSLSEKELFEQGPNQDVSQTMDEQAYKDQYTALSWSSQEKRA